MSKKDELIEKLTEDLKPDLTEITSQIINIAELESENRSSTRTEILHKMNIVDDSTGDELDSNCINISSSGILLYCFEGQFELDKIYTVNIKATETTPDFSVSTKLVRLVNEKKLGNKILGLKIVNVTKEQQNYINQLIA